MPVSQVYFPPDVYERLTRAAKSLSLSKRDFVRAVVTAALNELERERQSTESAEVKQCDR